MWSAPNILQFAFLLYALTLILPLKFDSVEAKSDTELLHMSPLKSGPHSPFPVQVAELGPINSNPGGQLNLIVLPFTGTSSSSIPTI